MSQLLFFRLVYSLIKPLKENLLPLSLGPAFECLLLSTKLYEENFPLYDFFKK